MGIAQAELFLGRADAALEAMGRAEAIASPAEAEAIRRARGEIERSLESAGSGTP